MTIQKMIAIPENEYKELTKKAEAYDKISAGGSTGGKKAWANITAEERSTRAKIAVEARIKKYGQKPRKITS